jgi:hypothetical protein
VAKPRIVRTPLTNSAYGYPGRGDKRRRKPVILLCLHISGNKRTAAMPALTGTRAEVSYMNRPASTGPSAHDYIARDGTIFRCFSARDYAGWSNGDVLAPMTQYKGVRKMLGWMRAGHNANEAFYREIEMTGFPGSYAPTKAQLESVAWQLARDSIATKLPIIWGSTVMGHFMVNSVNRPSCPFTGDRNAHGRALVKRAKELRRLMLEKPEPEPEPEPPPPDPDCATALEQALGRLEELEEEQQGWVAAAARIARVVAPFTEDD